MRVYFGAAVAIVLGLAASARAEPLNLNQVAADAKWVAHIDVDAVHASTVAHKALEQMEQKHPEMTEHLAKLKEVWKFNPRTDLHGVTIYGTQIKKDTGVAIVNAKVDKQLLLDKAKQAPDYKMITRGKYELHTWTHSKGAQHGRSMAGAFYKPDVLVFGASADEVAAALEVLDGTKPNIAAKSDSPLVGNVPAGAILVARAVDISEAKLPHSHPLAKQIDTLALAVGENKSESFLEARVTVKQADVAQQVKAIVDGAVAMAALVHGQDADLLKLINAVKVTADDKSVTVKWQAPADAVWAAFQKICEEMSHRNGPAQHAAPPHHPAEEE